MLLEFKTFVYEVVQVFLMTYSNTTFNFLILSTKATSLINPTFKKNLYCLYFI